MKELKVLVCDDIPERGKDTVGEINKVREIKADIGIRIQKLFGEELSVEIKKLFKRVKEHLASDDTGQSESAVPFNHAELDFDVVIIDNNLAALDIDGVRLTAEAVAGFVRAFTNTCYVVSLNKNPGVDFDLRYLVGDYQTQADLALNTRHLSNPALWTGSPQDTEDGFLPGIGPFSGISRRSVVNKSNYYKIH